MPALTPAQQARANAQAREAEARREREREAAAADSARLLAEIADDRGIRGLIKRGYDVQGNTLMLNGVALYDSAVVDPYAKVTGLDQKEAAAIRGTFRPGYEAAFNKWLHFSLTDHARFNVQNPAAYALNNLLSAERNALSEGTSSLGGYLAPPSLLAEILGARAAVAVVRQFVRAVPTEGSELQVPLAANHGSSPDTYNSAFVGGWYGETQALAFTDDPSFQMATIPLRKIRVATKPTSDLLEDSPALLDWLGVAGGENLAALEDAGFFAGTGSGNEPLGIIPAYSGTTYDIEGTTSNTISNTASDAGSAPKLVAFMHSLPSQYMPRARWFMRNAIEGDIRILIDGEGHFLWPRTDGTFQGQPVSHSDAIPTDGENAARCVLFGDLGAAALIAEKPGVTVDVERMKFVSSDEVGVWLKQRSNIALINQRALKVGVV